LERLNEGGAFDSGSGIFTVPVPGIYHFDFSAIKSASSSYLHIYLQVNGNFVSRAATDQPVTGSNDAVSLSTSLRLASGDKVNMCNGGNGVLLESGNSHNTHFSGWLVEEDLM